MVHHDDIIKYISQKLCLNGFIYNDFKDYDNLILPNDIILNIERFEQLNPSVKKYKKKYLSYIIATHDLNEINILKNLYNNNNNIKNCLMYLLDFFEKWKLVGLFDFIKSSKYYSNIIPIDFIYEYVNTLYIFDISSIITGLLSVLYTYPITMLYFNENKQIANNTYLILVEHITGHLPIVRLTSMYDKNLDIILYKSVHNPFIPGTIFKINNKKFKLRSCKYGTIYKYDSTTSKYSLYFNTSDDCCSFFISDNDTRIGYNIDNNQSTSTNNIIKITNIEYSIDNEKTFINNFNFGDLQIKDNFNFKNSNNVLYSKPSSITSIMIRNQLSNYLLFDNFKVAAENSLLKLPNNIIKKQDSKKNNKFYIDNKECNDKNILNFIYHLIRIYNIKQPNIKTFNYTFELLFNINYKFLEDNNYFECNSKIDIDDDFILTENIPIWDNIDFKIPNC